jgi:hypothetical protein
MTSSEKEHREGIPVDNLARPRSTGPGEVVIHSSKSD